MKKSSKVLILHQDIYLIEAMLKDLSKVFAELILWDGKDLQELKQKMGLFRYLFANAMPYIRGSAAIAEWYEHLIYKYHNVNFKYKTGVSIDCEALATPSLAEFISKLDSMYEYIRFN
jgi:hypothetical protein